MSTECLDDEGNENVEYVEFLNVYDETNIDGEGKSIISLEENDEEVITLDDDNCESVEYIKAEEISYNEISEDANFLNGHTIFVHDGKQYIIPNELNQNGQTIIFEGEDDGTQYVIQAAEEQTETAPDANVLNYVQTCYENVEIEETDSAVYQDSLENDDTCYIIYGENGETVAHINEEEKAALGKEYAVITDGAVHIKQNGNSNNLNEIQEKLQAFKDSFQYQEETVSSENELKPLDVTGRNMITGQTISLNGFLEKLRRKSDPLKPKQDFTESECYPPSIKRQRRSYYQSRAPKISHELPVNKGFISIPPIKRKVVIGRTPEGKKLVGRILQIQKKINDPSDYEIVRSLSQINESNASRFSTPRKSKNEDFNIIEEVEEEGDQKQKIEELIVNNTGEILHMEEQEFDEKSIKEQRQKKYIDKSTIPSDSLIRTLSGLMDLEIIQKNLTGKNLIVKHVLKKADQGNTAPEKIVTYHFGYMKKSKTVDCFNEPKDAWVFVPNVNKPNESTSMGQSIDLQENDDSQQINMIVNNDGKITLSSLTEADDTDAVCMINETDSNNVKQQFQDTVTINLIVKEGEHGKRKTKVIIPQLAEKQYSCNICMKTFSNAGSLTRHMSMHESAEKIFKCNICSQRFIDEASLRRHNHSHIANKKLRCDICFRPMANQTELTYHRKTHEPAKRYKCEVCSKQFNRYSNMMRHLVIHRVKTSAYKCDICGSQYNFISTLTRHIVNAHMGRTEEKSDQIQEISQE